MKIAIKPSQQVALSGQLDSKGAGLICDELIEFCRDSTANVLLDMSGVVGCTRAGSGVIFVAAKLLQQNGARLQIRNARFAIVKTISGRGFDHLLKIETFPQDFESESTEADLSLSVLAFSL